ncbi:hypothetical protein ACFSO7_17570 [Bacillus sp. CGMCC 1.16607]|uniref:hypothetical protein n=1 Tax=Bacillus sp. CGMCC 1.16607 TaxID=3351842 RepID=UPI00363755EF
MFDPTAFDNMKVVIEGYLYDKDIDGELNIVDRNDVINLAKLSREYSIKFCLKNSPRESYGDFCLKAGLENLSAELLPIKIKPRQGCVVQLQFFLTHPNEADFYYKIQNELGLIWGTNRKITQSIQVDPLKENLLIQNRIIIDFNRLIEEDQIDDLVDIVDHMVQTLIWMETLSQ